MQKLLVSFPATNQESPHQSIQLYPLLLFVLFLRINQKSTPFLLLFGACANPPEAIKIISK